MSVYFGLTVASGAGARINGGKLEPVRKHTEERQAFHIVASRRDINRMPASRTPSAKGGRNRARLPL